MSWLKIDRAAKTSLMKQIYDQVRMRILNGDLHEGELLPSTRQLATDLQIARIVVLEAYEQLQAEGYLESRQGAGTYVAAGAFLEPQQPEWFSQNSTESEHAPSNLIDFRSGLPALDYFPRKLWGQLARQVYTEARVSAFGYEQPEGCIELRSALVRYLWKTRGVRCDLQHILITSGAAQAFSLLARLLLSQGAHALCEDPGMADVQEIFSSAGGKICSVPVDEYGMRTELLPDQERPGLVLVTPSHQFPLGGILPIQRRIQLIQFARLADCYILEDDYDSEYRYTGTPVSSLHELAPERVIYVGTLSKCFFPALRLGYVVLPEPLVEPVRRLKRQADLHSPVAEQLIMARFLQEGHLERHILRMKKLYRHRREVLIAALQKHFIDQVQISGSATGLHLIAKFPSLIFTEQCIADLEQSGVRVYPVERHAIQKGIQQSKLILGYGNLAPELIEEGVRRMSLVLKR